MRQNNNIRGKIRFAGKNKYISIGSEKRIEDTEVNKPCKNIAVTFLSSRLGASVPSFVGPSVTIFYKCVEYFILSEIHIPGAS